MALVSGESFSTLEPAADLLVKTGHAPEAVEFLDALVKSTPGIGPPGSASRTHGMQSRI